MVYVVPQVQVFEEFDLVPTPAPADLPAHISGGHAYLLRYSEDAEKKLGFLGQYDPNVDTAFLWPERPTGALVDRSYTKLFIDDALLPYWNSSAGEGGDTVLTLAGFTNRLRAADTVFSTNGTANHSAVFLDRGVKVGDAVKVVATVDDVHYELCTYVAGFIGETVAATRGSTQVAAENAVGTSSTFSSEFAPSLVGVLDNCIDTVTQVGDYNGKTGGHVDTSFHMEETYTVEVIQGSVDQDFTTALFRVTSESGTDDVGSAAIVDGVLAVGTRGLSVSFSVSNDDPGADCSLSALLHELPPYDFVAGQKWIIATSGAFTAPTAVFSGTYTGKADDTYIVEITKGRATGALNSTTAAEFSVRTIKGLDISGPTKILATTAYAAGALGLSVAFNSTTNLRKGDRFYVDVTARSAGALQTLQLGHSLPPEVVAAGAGVSAIVTLYIRENIQVTANRIGFAPETNFEQSDTEFTVDAGIVAYASDYTDDGVPVALPVVAECDYSKVYVEARYWRRELSVTLGSVSDPAGLDAVISGPLHPDNPLKYGVLKALQNSNGRQVTFTACCDPNDVDQWLNVLEIISEKRGVYGLVPLTRNPLVLSAYQAHIDDQSSPDNGRWRVGWFNASGAQTKSIVSAKTSSNLEVVLAVFEDDPFTAGSQYTQVRVPAGNSLLVTDGVRAGDVVRAHYTTDGFGGETYTEYTIDEVINEDTLRLVAGPNAGVSIAEKIEVWRNLTNDELSQEIALAGGFADRRIRMVWPDTIEADGFSVPGYFLCAALSGLTSGVVPHQGLTNLQINGFTSVLRTTGLFSRDQLNVMAGGGIWIVTQDLGSGDIYSRHAVTTGDTDNLVQREEQVTRNTDSIAFFFLDLYAPYIGVSNVTTSLLSMLRDETAAGISLLMSTNYVQRLGPQLILGTITQIAPHPILKDRVVIAIKLTEPFPLNNVECHLQLVA